MHQDINKSQVYDCFLFFNELDLLEIRLNILSETVDRFVLVEADRTFSNNPKPFYFEENRQRYKHFLERIIHIKIQQYPEIKTAWEMESYQRNQIALGIEQCLPNDIILISDLDEIPNDKAVKNYIKSEKGICALEQLHFDYYLNYQRCGKNDYWYNAKILRYRDIVNNTLPPATPQDIRKNKGNKSIKEGGWHFSFLGGIQNIKYKIQSFSHQEWNNEKYLNDTIEYKIKMGIDLFDRKNIRLIPIRVSSKKYPRYILDNQEKYSHLIYPHIDHFIAIKNRLYCLPYYFYRLLVQVAKKVLPKGIIQKVKSRRK